jgi:hypothetical protein
MVARRAWSAARARRSVAVTPSFAAVAGLAALAVLVWLVAGSVSFLVWVAIAAVIFDVLILGGLGVLAGDVAKRRAAVASHAPDTPADNEPRLLVVADANCNESALADAIRAHAGGAKAVHLVVPVRLSQLHLVMNDEGDERRDAEQSVLIAVGILERHGIAATGSVGSDDPLQSMIDALTSFPATVVLLALPPEEESYWLDRHLVDHARAATDARVVQVVVASPSAGAGSASDIELATRAGAAERR